MVTSTAKKKERENGTVHHSNRVQRRCHQRDRIENTNRYEGGRRDDIITSIDVRNDIHISDDDESISTMGFIHRHTKDAQTI